MPDWLEIGKSPPKTIRPQEPDSPSGRISHRSGDQAAGRVQGPTAGGRTHTQMDKPFPSHVHKGKEKAANYLSVVHLVSAVITYHCAGLLRSALNHHHHLACLPRRSPGQWRAAFVSSNTLCAGSSHTLQPIPVHVRAKTGFSRHGQMGFLWH